MNGYFVTGTDTGIGKTHVACLLVRRAVANGLRVFGFKPIETGIRPGDLGADQAALIAAAGAWQTGELQGIYRLVQPAAPWVAAAAEGIRIDLERVVEVSRQGAARADLSVVEGAGGWRVPLTTREDMSALPRRLDLPVIVVARATLGTINHSLLTVEAVERDGCRVAALVLSERPEDDADFTRSNAEQIAARWAGRILICRSDGTALDPLLF